MAAKPATTRRRLQRIESMRRAREQNAEFAKIAGGNSSPTLLHRMLSGPGVEIAANISPRYRERLEGPANGTIPKGLEKEFMGLRALLGKTAGVYYDGRRGKIVVALERRKWK